MRNGEQFNLNLFKDRGYVYIPKQSVDRYKELLPNASHKTEFAYCNGKKVLLDKFVN